MLNRWSRRILVAGISLVLTSCVLIQALVGMPSTTQLLTDPFLQLPTENSVRVVWFTEFAGTRHTVTYGQDFKQTIVAQTQKLSRTREDPNSNLTPRLTQLIDRPIWRHEAEVTGLHPTERVPYRVTSAREDGERISSQPFTLTAKPPAGTPLKILLTSDHQLKPMVAANLQKVVETVGRVDAVFFAGDLVNVPDRASEWFDDQRGGAFFPALQGRARYELTKAGHNTRYVGGEIIQHAPLFATIGNHEVMGRFSTTDTLNAQFDDAFPRNALLPSSDTADRPSEIALKNQSFNTDTYEEIFTLPDTSPGGKRYYATTFGDVRLVVLYITNAWRSPKLDANTRGKYRERERDLETPNNWGHGQLIFESIVKGSQQYRWLEQELQSPEFQQAKYRVVMFHHPPHSLGENSVPAYTDPVQVVERDPQGRIQSIRYEYPLKDDYIIRDVVPLLESANVQLVFYGHSHLWNRFVSSSGMYFLETSNVGNSYGAYVGDDRRIVPTNYQEVYAAIGDPNGLAPIVPTLAPLNGADGKPQPFIASNDVTAFSIFDTGTGRISSYRFDTREPNSAVVKFDEFQLKH